MVPVRREVDRERAAADRPGDEPGDAQLAPHADEQQHQSHGAYGAEDARELRLIPAPAAAKPPPPLPIGSVEPTPHATTTAVEAPCPAA